MSMATLRNADSASQNDFDFEVQFEESEFDDDYGDDDVPVVDRWRTNGRYVENFEYTHEFNPFSRRVGRVNPSLADTPLVKYFYKFTLRTKKGI